MIPGPRLLCGTPRHHLEQRPRPRALRLRRGGRDPPRGARELPARGRSRQDLRHRRGQLAGHHARTRASTRARRSGPRSRRRERAGKYAAAHAHGGPGLRLCVEEGVSHHRARRARHRRGHRADEGAPRLAHLHLLDLHARARHRAGRRAQPRHHGEAGCGAPGRRRDLPAPPRLGRALRLRHRRGARRDAVRAGDARALRVSRRGTRCCRARAGAPRPAGWTPRWAAWRPASART